MRDGSGYAWGVYNANAAAGDLRPDLPGALGAAGARLINRPVVRRRALPRGLPQALARGLVGLQVIAELLDGPHEQIFVAHPPDGGEGGMREMLLFDELVDLAANI